MNGGRLFVIGLGPGDLALLTPEAQAALDDCTDLFGYFPYIERLPERPGTRHHASDNREELDRARAALTLAAEGRTVGVVSGGDPGVFAMASAIFEAIESGAAAWARAGGDGCPRHLGDAGGRGACGRAARA